MVLGAALLAFACAFEPRICAALEALYLQPAPVWTPAQADAARAVLAAAAEKGLRPDDYAAAADDVALSAAVMRYAADVAEGRVDPRAMGADLAYPRERVDLAALVREAAGGDVRQALQSVEPRLPMYRRALQALRDSRAIAADSPRIRPLELLLERLRWLPQPFETPAIVVNIPAFELRAIGPSLSMKVVVGSAWRHRTPVFSAPLREIVFAPWWNVPSRIAREEIAPHLQELQADGFEADGERIRQRPGPRNALGPIKFVLPNRHGVYLHGTPARKLFTRPRRDFSHGCIRVEDPEALAAWALPSWSREEIRAAMHGETQRVPLERPIPVFILYSTAVVGEDGAARFFDDIYGQDAALERALTTPPRGAG